jgi:hypothetical protein
LQAARSVMSPSRSAQSHAPSARPVSDLHRYPASLERGDLVLQLARFIIHEKHSPSGCGLFSRNSIRHEVIRIVQKPFLQ